MVRLLVLYPLQAKTILIHSLFKLSIILKIHLGHDGGHSKGMPKSSSVSSSDETFGMFLSELESMGLGSEKAGDGDQIQDCWIGGAGASLRIRFHLTHRASDFIKSLAWMKFHSPRKYFVKTYIHLFLLFII